ncbi:MAG: large ribosomal subunit protein bL28 [Planctomycetota bacterium]
MSKVCEKCGKKPVSGKSYARRGLAKAKGGVGRKVTGKPNRRFVPNIQIVRVKEQNGTVRRRRFCAKCLKTGLRNGTISKAPRKPRPPREVAAPEPEVVAAPLEHEPAALEEGAAPREEGGMSTSLAEELDTAYEEEKADERSARAEEVAGEAPETPEVDTPEVDTPHEEQPPEPPADFGAEGGEPPPE